LLVADLAAVNREPLPTYRNPDVRLVPVPHDVHLGIARSTAAIEARAPIVAYLEEHAVAYPGWVAAILEAFQHDWDAIGFEVHNANPGVGASSACFMLSYARWAPPARAGETRILPAMNVAFRRDVLLSFRDSLPGLMIFEAAMHDAMRKRGDRLGIVPAARIGHYNEPHVRTAVLGNLLCHRVMAHSRVTLLNWSAPMRALHVITAPLVPWYRLARMTADVMLRRPHQLGAWIKAIPNFLLCSHAAALGKAEGLLWGPGDAPARFTRLELAAPREAEDLVFTW
jgi:hypothetical protein